jgi:hypothetical protein
MDASTWRLWIAFVNKNVYLGAKAEHHVLLLRHFSLLQIYAYHSLIYYECADVRFDE